MAEKPSSAFRSIEQYASQDVQKAAILSQADAAHAQVAEVQDSENEPLIPLGSKILFKPIDAARVKKGRFIFLRRTGSLLIRRLVGRRITPQGLYMLTATARGKMDDEPIPASNLLGEILAVDPPRGKRFDPARRGNVFGHWLTEWGTISPGRKMGKMLLVFLPPRMRGEG